MNNLAKGLNEFQFKCPAIVKDSQVTVRTKSGHEYNFKYATYGNIIQTIKPAMHESKLSYTFFTSETQFTCRVMHESGECMDTSIPMPRFKESMQENGSLLTYCKRYALVLALGLDTDADDDCNLAEGNSATFNQKPQPQQPQTQKPVQPTANKSTKKVTENQLKRLYAIQEKSGWQYPDVLFYAEKNFACEPKDLNMSQYDELCNYIMNNKREEGIPF